MSIHSGIVIGQPSSYSSWMRRAFSCLAMFAVLSTTSAAEGGTGRVIKVLPEFVDLEGRASLSPSLYERDAYQAVLREHPEKRSGVRFFVQWKTRGPIWEPLKLRIEVRGAARGNLPQQLVLEEPLANGGGKFTHWASPSIEGLTYRQFGGVTAWRATLWEGKRLLSEQKSFLW